MPKPDKAARRDAKRQKERYGMNVRGRSLITVILPVIGKKARKKARK